MPLTPPWPRPKKISKTKARPSDYHEDMVYLIEAQDGLVSLEMLMLMSRETPELYPLLQIYRSATRFEFIIHQLKEWGIVEQVEEKYQLIPGSTL